MKWNREPFYGRLTVRKLKEILNGWPEEDRDGEETEVWLESGRNLTTQCREVFPLNLRDWDNDEPKSADIVLSYTEDNENP